MVHKYFKNIKNTALLSFYGENFKITSSGFIFGIILVSIIVIGTWVATKYDLSNNLVAVIAITAIILIGIAFFLATERTKEKKLEILLNSLNSSERKKFSFESFVGHFKKIGVPEVLSKQVYSYLKWSIGERNFNIMPSDLISLYDVDLFGGVSNYSDLIQTLDFKNSKVKFVFEVPSVNKLKMVKTVSDLIITLNNSLKR